MKGRYWLAVVILLLLYWWLALSEVTVLPPVHEDESWIAAHAWGLAHDGIFGARMFAGLWGLESRTYVFMPVFALIQSAVFWGAGLTLFTTRYLSLLAGALTVALTLHVGRRRFDFGTALMAAVLLIGWRIAGPLPNRPFGIPLMDTARVARYDALVPVFGLLAWAVYGTAVRRANRRAYGLAGFLTGLAGLTHIYGVFWLAVLLVLAGRDRVGRQAWPLMALGFAIPLSIYGLYVAGGFENWQQQITVFASAERFAPFAPAWYGRNLGREPLRYLPALAEGRAGLASLLQPGVFLLLGGVPAALVWLWRFGGRNGRSLLLPLLLLPLFFGLFITPKVPAYLMAFWPLVVLALAVVIVKEGWRAGKWRRLGALLLLVLVLGEGGWRLAQTRALASQTSPYTAYTGAISAELPAKGLVLGLHKSWLGLADYDYRSWGVPLLGRQSPTPGGLVAAVDALEPAAVLIDADMRAYFGERPAEWAAVEGWLAENGFGQPALVADPTYGRTAVYQRQTTGESP